MLIDVPSSLDVGWKLLGSFCLGLSGVVVSLCPLSNGLYNAKQASRTRGMARLFVIFQQGGAAYFLK